MKIKHIVGALVVLVVLGAGVFSGFRQSGAGENTNGDFMSEYKSAENAVLVDIRTADEYHSGHVVGAVNVDFYDPAFVEKMKALGTDKNFFIYCRSGNRSGQALSMLRANGLNAEHLSGGVVAHPEVLR